MVVFQWNKVFRLPLYVVHQIMSNFCKQNCFKTSEINLWWKPSPKSRITDRSLIMVVFQCNKVCLILLCVMHQILSKFLTQNCVKTSEISIDKNPYQHPETLIGAKKCLDSNETKCLRFLHMWYNKFQAHFTNRTSPPQATQVCSAACVSFGGLFSEFRVL